ncbi:1-phosphofructokinase family hexose kinase [Microbacterium sp. zg.Y1084]|uniref:1-phosphofructokinase family hexose kinase n=1 Tax=Microbacterium sp. zg.Y1084 TaxID=2969667 RepID=UPI00214C34C0|nr:hexose kinase [Microbacterium sp. zg.Y1084]MCR2812370.1 hexose kinase [Microbacterium sp. zg.Y1084]
MILTVTPNPALDGTWHVDGLAAGESHRVATGAQRAGGKGVNVARVLAAAGDEVLALMTAGGASGHALGDDLRAAGIAHRLVPVAAPTRRSIAVVDDTTGEATLLNERGAALSPEEAAAFRDEACSLATRAAAVVVSGSLPPGLAAGDVAAIVAAPVASGIVTIADVTGAALWAAAEAGAHVLKPNAAELRETTGTDDVMAGAQALLQCGAGLVVVSLGAEGMLLVRRTHPSRGLRARLPCVLQGNPTGAGDAAVAALAHLLAARGTAEDLGDEELAQLARTAVGWSASAVLMPLAGDLSSERDALTAAVIFDTDSRNQT